MMKVTFRVINDELGREPTPDELKAIARDGTDGGWATYLCWTDIDGWYIDQDGNLVLADECGNFAFAPEKYRVEWIIEIPA